MNKIRLFFLNRFALNAYISQDYGKALFWYEKIHGGYPCKPGLKHNIGLCHFAMQDYGRAEVFFRKEIETYGETADRLRTLGDLYYRWKKQTQALKYYKRLKDYLNYAEKWLEIRIALLSSEKQTEKAFTAADKLDEALVMMKAGLTDEARTLLEQGAGEDPSSFQIVNNLGVIALKEENDPAKAVSYFKHAEELLPLPMHKANLKKAQELLNNN